ncbi:MAG: hypothetical protein JKY55_13440 [Aliivibrio sp.]|uniref:hypothetical protein n=1 Tax=Aliivibrio sp. TaxID=1872443 RepID=UPI001A47D364|nr:hypothetical protein [Aliivibrio sp.]
MIEFIKKVKIFVVGAGAEMTHTDTEQEQEFLLELVEDYESNMMVSLQLESEESQAVKTGPVAVSETFSPVVKVL